MSSSFAQLTKATYSSKKTLLAVSVIVSILFILSLNGSTPTREEAHYEEPLQDIVDESSWTITNFTQDNSHPSLRQTYNKWRSCLQSKISQLQTADKAKELWDGITKQIMDCSHVGDLRKLRIDEVSNMEEIKYDIKPAISEPSVFVTLGIGRNTIGEEKVVKILDKKSRFYGADPMIDVNRDIYAKFGTYFPFAVSNSSGMLKASVLQGGSYHDQVVINIEFLYFLKNILKEKFYDTLWMDNEYAEFVLLPYFYKGGILDQNDITICQINMEVHSPSEQQRQSFQRSVFQLLSDGVYSILRCVDVGHLRLYIVNFSNPKCVQKYLQEAKSAEPAPEVVKPTVSEPSEKPTVSEPTDNGIQSSTKSYWQCLRNETLPYNEDFNLLWNQSEVYTRKCREATNFKQINLTPVQNSDETKYYVFPDNKTTDPSVVVTLGIGADVAAEKFVKDRLPKESEFFGADPVTEQNAELFSQIGVYFPLAVANFTGRSQAFIRTAAGPYIVQTMTHIDIGTFLTQMVNRTRIDHLFMDNEGPEYEILPLMGKGQLFDQLNIVVCQMNVELHAATAGTERAKAYRRIMKGLIADERYAPLNSQNVGHIRAFFLNVENKYCVDKYIRQFFQ